MIQTEDQRSRILGDLTRRMFEKFSNEQKTWKHCVNSVATIDVLLSMATYGNTLNHSCLPEILDGDDGVSFCKLISFCELNVEISSRF